MNDELQYFVNQKKKTITCKSTGCKYDLYQIFAKIISSEKTNIKDLICKLFADESFLLNSTYTGTAKCLGQDEFDITKGQKIARAKMRKKYTKDKLKLLSSFKSDLSYTMALVDNVIQHEQDKLLVCEEVIKKEGK